MSMTKTYALSFLFAGILLAPAVFARSSVVVEYYNNDHYGIGFTGYRSNHSHHRPLTRHVVRVNKPYRYYAPRYRYKKTHHHYQDCGHNHDYTVRRYYDSYDFDDYDDDYAHDYYDEHHHRY
ncbi:MAG: hypothetical protein ACWA5R_02735 [bacterium]